MRDQLFEAEQTIPRPRSEVFAFFADPANLESITPPWLRFRIVARTTAAVRDGSEFTYRLRLHGLPLTWVSRITRWEPGTRFVDEQVRGPYALWEHLHTFRDGEGGTVVGDRVRWRLPLAVLSHPFAAPFVRRDVERIFAFRRRRLEKLLAVPAPGPRT
ncbi:MAG: CDP-paratose 2-epimerase [Acidobacteria bacterium]|nr:MAG: CDP-paratose 2-epimerase [Acidobacteriota bacterium]